MELDLTKSRYETFEDLYTYCYKVAGVIGLIMLKIFGYKNQEAAKYAVDLGIAMQLTNILRDIKEDCLRKRIYLPLNELNNFGVYEKDILNSKMNNNLESLLRFQLERAKKYYETSLKGVNLIDNKRAEFVVKLMANMYCAILDDIEKHNFDIFTRRAHTSILDKLTVLLKTFINN
jgi:phytoene synthase